MKKKSLYFKDHPYCLYESVANSPFPLPTNSLGLVGKKEYSKAKNKDVKRILFLGASPIERLPPAAENKSCNPNLTVTHLIESKLNKKSKETRNNKKYEVLNLSSTAYTSYECLLSYICKGRYFNPDLVISYQGVNDVLWSIIASGYLKDYSHARRNNFFQQECILNDFLCALPDNKLIDLLEKILLRFNLKKPNGLIYSISKKDLKLDLTYSSDKLNTFLDNILILNNLCLMNKSKLLNITFVWNHNKPANPSHVYKELKEKKYKEIFNRFYNDYLLEINKLLLENDQLNTLKLNQEIFNESTFSDGVHFSYKGMELFSSIVADYLFHNNDKLF